MSEQMNLSPLIVTYLSLFLIAFTIALVPLFAKHQKILIYVSFPLMSIASAIAVVAGIWSVAIDTPESVTLSIGLPDLPFHLRLDPLSGFFLTTIGLLSFFVSIYSTGYCKGYVGKRSVTHFVIFYSLFIAGMFLVVLSDDAFFFLISWELMAIASYRTTRNIPAIKREKNITKCV